MKNTAKGFTIVELLIVIVVIAVLASISVAAYNGIQTRAKTSALKSKVPAIEKALSLYFIDNSKYPDCTGNISTPGTSGGCSVSGLSTSLVPKYLKSMPTNQTDDNSFYYSYGTRKTGTNSYTNDGSNNYAIQVYYEDNSLEVKGSAN